MSQRPSPAPPNEAGAPEDERIPGIYHAAPAEHRQDLGGDATDPGNEDMGPDEPARVPVASTDIGYGEDPGGGRGPRSPAET